MTAPSGVDGAGGPLGPRPRPALAAADQVSASPVARALWVAAGLVAVAVGGIGIVVPGLPTTVFFIVAAWCFSHGSERFERWVLGLPRIGPMVRDYRAGLGMPRWAKGLALVMMWAAIAVSAWLLWDRPWLVAVVAVLGLVGTVVIVWRVPTREDVLAGSRPEHPGPGTRRSRRSVSR